MNKSSLLGNKSGFILFCLRNMLGIVAMLSNCYVEFALVGVSLFSLIVSLFFPVKVFTKNLFFCCIIVMISTILVCSNLHQYSIFPTLVLVSMMLTLYLHHHYNSSSISNFGTYFLIITSFLGLFFVLKARHFLSLYLSFEMISFTGYTMVALLFKKPFASESAMKYFIIGSVSSAIMLFGISFVYGGSHSITFSEINTKNIITVLGLILFFAGIFFKLSAFPFHFWAPDVYQTISIPSLSVISIVPKIAGIIALIHILPHIQHEIIYITLLCSCILSMVIGAVGGIFQTHVNKIIAYSGIANIGFVLSVVILPVINQTVIIEYLTIYTVSLLFVFFILANIRKCSSYDATLASLMGFYKKNAMLSFLFSIALLNLAGIPPLAGFYAKYFVIKELILQNNFYLPVVIIVASAVSLFYYLKIIKTIYFSKAIDDSMPYSSTISPVMYICIAILFLFVTLYTLLYGNAFYSLVLFNFA